jgi:AcrR family transcriptional regulator
MAMRKTLRPEDLSAAALEIVAESGIGGLTLRPLAARLGTTVSVVSYQFGQKEQILESVIGDAARTEAAYLDGWRRLLGPAPAISASVAAQVLEHILIDLTGEHRAHTLLFSELLFNVTSVPESEALAAWCGNRRRFCAWLAGHMAPVPFDLAGLIDGFLIEECAYSMALDRLESYRWLRRLCIARLTDGLLPAGGDAADQALFDAHFKALRLHANHAVTHRNETYDRGQDDIVHASADLISENGISGLTHRSVGQRAGVAASTVAYHFPTQPDLVRAGLARLIPAEQTRIQRDGTATYLSDENGEGRRPLRRFQAFEIARSGFGVALSAVRDAEWLAIAADLRALRGLFLSNTLIAEMEPVNFDRLGVQALVLSASGCANKNAWRGAELATGAALQLVFDTLKALQ